MGSIDYVVTTPDCQSQQQLYHINMLKEYHEWNCDGEKTCAVVIMSIPGAVCGKREAVEGNKLDSDYLCDTGMRLNNSEALVNLRSKLNH